jgi:hypothetical protein
MMPRTTDLPRPRGGTGPRSGPTPGCSSEGGWLELMTCNLGSCDRIENAPWGELRRRRFAERRHPGGGLRLVGRIAIDTWRTDRSKAKRLSMALQRGPRRHFDGRWREAGLPSTVQDRPRRLEDVQHEGHYAHHGTERISSVLRKARRSARPCAGPRPRRRGCRVGADADLLGVINMTATATSSGGTRSRPDSAGTDPSGLRAT